MSTKATPKQPVKVESTFSKTDAIKIGTMIGCTLLIIISNFFSNLPTEHERAWQYFAAREIITESMKDSEKTAKLALTLALDADNEAKFEEAWDIHMKMTKYAEQDNQLWQQLKKGRPSLSSKYQKELDKVITDETAKKETMLNKWKENKKEPNPTSDHNPTTPPSLK